MPVLVSTGHNEDEEGAWRYVAARMTHWAADVITYVSAGAAQQAARRGAAPSHRIQVVPNGIELSINAAAPEVRADQRARLGLSDAFVWLAMGRLALQKDYPTMLAAFVEVCQRYPGARLLIAGDGPLRDR